MSIITDPPRAFVQTKPANGHTDPGSVPVPGKVGMGSGALLTAGRWSAVMASLVVVSLVLSVFSLQFGTQWIGLTQIIDILGKVLREGTAESEHIGTIGVIL